MVGARLSRRGCLAVGFLVLAACGGDVTSTDAGSAQNVDGAASGTSTNGATATGATANGTGATAGGASNGDSGAGASNAGDSGASSGQATDSGSGASSGGATDGGSTGSSGSLANGVFLAVGGGTKIARSEDGVSWTTTNDTRTGDAAGWTDYDTQDLFRAACAGKLPNGNQVILAVGGGTQTPESCPGRIARSLDGGKTWQHQNSINGAAPTELIPGNWLGGCGFGNGRVVVMGGEGVVFTSTDAVNWKRHSMGSFDGRNGTFGNGVFVAVGEQGIVVSSDGEKWEVVSRQEAKRVHFHDGVFIAAPENGTDYQRSTDGRNWTSFSAPATVNRVGHDGTQFIASSEAGVVLTSADGKSFVANKNKNNQGLWGIAYGKGTYVSMLEDNIVLYYKGSITAASPSWTRVTLPGDSEKFHHLSIWFFGSDP